MQLMKEIEQKRPINERLKSPEAEHAGLNKRYQTTLEMLGEKSETVDSQDRSSSEREKTKEWMLQEEDALPMSS